MGNEYPANTMFFRTFITVNNDSGAARLLNSSSTQQKAICTSANQWLNQQNQFHQATTTAESVTTFVSPGYKSGTERGGDPTNGSKPVKAPSRHP